MFINSVREPSQEKSNSSEVLESTSELSQDRTELAMEVLEPFAATILILHESIKLLQKNGKLVALTVVPTLLLSSLFFLVFSFSSRSLFRDMLMRESLLSFSNLESTDEFTTALARLKRDVGLIFVVDLTFILAYWIISLFSITASILLSAISHNGGTLSYKDFALLVAGSWKRPLMTGFYTTLLGTGYFFFISIMATPLFLFYNFDLAFVRSSIIWYGIPSYILYLYLSVAWILSIVVSVSEENCYGIEALGKAGGLIKGKRVQGFILNTIFAALSAVLFLVFRIIRGPKWLSNDTISGLFGVNLSCLIKLFQFVGYTVLYFQCKKHHGEEIELQGGEAEFYSKITTAEFPSEDVA